jgi:hypothetical protein
MATLSIARRIACNESSFAAVVEVSIYVPFKRKDPVPGSGAGSHHAR